MSDDFVSLLNEPSLTPEKFSQPSKIIQFPINQIKVGSRFRKEVGELTGLIESIKKNGLINPILLTPEGELIAGYRRYLACKKLEMETIDAKIVDVGDVKELEMDENLARKDFTLSEKAEIAEFLLKKEKELARQRMRLGGARKSELADLEKGRALDKVAKRLGLSRPTLRKIMEIYASGREDLIQKMDKTGKVDPVYRKLKTPKTDIYFNKLSQTELEELIKNLISQPEAKDHPILQELKRRYIVYQPVKILHKQAISWIFQQAKKQQIELTQKELDELKKALEKADKYLLRKMVKILERYYEEWGKRNNKQTSKSFLNR